MEGNVLKEAGKINQKALRVRSNSTKGSLGLVSSSQYSQLKIVRGWTNFGVPADQSNYFFSSVKKRDSEFKQYRNPVGAGPSSKTCPRWASHRAQLISVRTIPQLLSVISEM